MPHSLKLLCAALLALPIGAPLLHTAEQAHAPSPQITQPATDVVIHPEYAKAIAQMAYIWGWPMVNMLNRNDTITKASHPGLLDGMLHDYITPQETFVTCPSQDVVYGLGFFSVGEEPVIVQVPDFGERFWVYSIYDQRTDQVGELGKPYGAKPGFYLLVGPNWNGDKPEGVEAIIRSPTALTNAIPRIADAVHRVDLAG